MAIELFDIKAKKKVYVDESKVRKVTVETRFGKRYYLLRAKTDDGRVLTKSISKDDWDKLNLEEENINPDSRPDEGGNFPR